MLLHGTYDNGKITILNKKTPKIKANVEIKVSDKPWVRKINIVTIKGKPLSDAIISERYGE